MRTLKLAAMLGTLGMAAAGNPAWAQGVAVAGSGVPQAQSPARGAKSGGLGQDHKTTPPEQVHPDKPARPDYPDQVTKLLDDIKTVQAKFLKDEKNLREKLKQATAAERDQIRTEMRDKRDAFLEQQKEMREEFRKRVLELKSQLPNHGDVIDAAKEQAKDKKSARKGGGD